MGRRPVLIRADASVAIGTGHVMRDLVLARALGRENVPVTWLCRTLPASLEDLLRGHGFPVRSLDAAPGVAEADAISAAAAEIDACAVVVDHYGIDAATEARVRRTGVPVLAVDDMYQEHDADLVLNQNLYASSEAYRGRIPDDCRVLAGWRYALLRDEFVELPVRARSAPRLEGARVLVTLGGADHPNITHRVLRALERVEGTRLAVELIVGGANLHRDELVAAAAASHLDVSVLLDVRDIAQRMDRADLAVTAGGTTHLELTATALPSLMITIADNQTRVTGYMGDHGLAVDLGWHEDVDEDSIADAARGLLGSPDRYMEMHRRLARYGPPAGADRVARALLGIELRAFTLRPMGPDDLMDAFQLTNDPSVRAQSFSTDPVALEEHRRWFANRIEDRDGFFFSVRHPEYGFVGQLRLDRESDPARRWTVSISLTAAARGHGLGSLVIRRALSEALAGSGPHQVDAWVRSGNPASLRAFLDADFDDVGGDEVNGAAARLLVFRGE